MREGPSLQSMMDRLAAIPSEFIDFEAKKKERIKIPALVNDLLTGLGAGYLPPDEIKLFQGDPGQNPHLRVVAILCHIFHDSELCALKISHDRIRKFLRSERLSQLSACIGDTNLLVYEDERREEICRLALDAVGMFPAGESENSAGERLAGLDSVERNRILEKTRLAQLRAREIREAMLRKEAEEAASKMSRE